MARAKVAPLLQLCVFAYDCTDKGHSAPGTYHIDFSTMGSTVEIQGAIPASIAATEALLAALKAKLQ